jgi:hypothetical protein
MPKKKLIYDKAMELFSVYGYADTSIADISNATAMDSFLRLVSFFFGKRFFSAEFMDTNVSKNQHLVPLYYPESFRMLYSALEQGLFFLQAGRVYTK